MFSKVVSKSTTALRENEIGSLGNGTQLVTPCSKDLMVHYYLITPSKHIILTVHNKLAQYTSNHQGKLRFLGSCVKLFHNR